MSIFSKKTKYNNINSFIDIQTQKSNIDIGNKIKKKIIEPPYDTSYFKIDNNLNILKLFNLQNFLIIMI